MILYYFVLLILLLLCGPFLLLAKKRRQGIGQKLGLLPESISNLRKSNKEQCRIWFHAVSVGEFNACHPLITLIHEKHPDCKIFVSTSTATAQAIAQEKISSFATVFYFPLDLPWIVAKYLDAIKPDLVAIVETEIWPGFISQCKKRNIKIIVVNGRISPKSFKSYKRVKFFIGKALQNYSLVLSQSAADQQRYESLTDHQTKIINTGNLKFDGLKPLTAIGLYECTGLDGSEFVFIAGSTHEGEELMILNAWKELIKSNPNKVRLIIVPRHPERFERVANLIQENGFNCKRFSKQEKLALDSDIYLLDTMNKLFQFYNLANLAFVGGTLVPIGGHNLLEPYAYKVPVICGKHMEKTKEIALSLLANNALSVVNNQEELNITLQALYSDSQKRKKLGQAGYEIISQSQGACSNSMQYIENLLVGKLGLAKDSRSVSECGVDL